MHPAAFEAARRLLAGIGPARPRVLEIGSYDVNGSLRPLLAHARGYVGLDQREGPGVDVVADGATWGGDGELFDLVVTTETLEHAPDPGAVIANARRLLKAGGWLVLTCAGPERTPHSADGLAKVPKGEHYANISPEHLGEWLAGWEAVSILANPAVGDVYARARRPADPPPDEEPATAEETTADEEPRGRRKRDG